MTSGFFIDIWTFSYYVMSLLILLKPIMSGFLGHCSGKRRGLPPCYYQVEVDIQVPHSVSMDTQGS